MPHLCRKSSKSSCIDPIPHCFMWLDCADSYSSRISIFHLCYMPRRELVCQSTSPPYPPTLVKRYSHASLLRPSPRQRRVDAGMDACRSTASIPREEHALPD